MESLWKNDNWWVSPFNYHQDVQKISTIPENLQFHDVTLRDGEQTPGVVFRKDEKIEIARKLSEAGVHRIEAGMPAVSEEDRFAIEQIRKLNLKAQIYAFARPLESDINLCRDCGVQGLIIEVPIGKPKLQYQFKYGIEQALENSQKAVEFAKAAGLKVVLFPYDATRAQADDIEFYLNGLTGSYKPDSIGVVDTMGCATPQAISYMVKWYKEKLNIPVEIHVHNEFNMSVATSIAALHAGAEVVHCCINGLGERTGNTPLEDVAAALQLLYGFNTGIDIGKIVDLCQYVARMSNYPIAAKKSVTGSDIFVRESGIGADMVTSKPLAMFAVNPSFYKQKGSLVLGKKSGLLSIETKLEEMGISLDREIRKKILGDVKNLGVELKRYLTHEEFVEIVEKVSKEAQEI